MQKAKKVTVIFLAFCILIGILPVPVFAAAMPFEDVNRSDWYYDAVSYVREHNIMTGTSANKFDPNAEVTRAQMCQILYFIIWRDSPLVPATPLRMLPAVPGIIQQ